MKGKTLLIACLFCSQSYASSDSSLQDQTVNPSDPCTIVLCMAGKLEGASGGSQCSAAEKVFFSTIGKKHHVFNPLKTLTKRKALLGQCSSGADLAVKILAKYGKLKG